RHMLWDFSGRLEVQTFVANGLFVSPWAEIIEKRHPEVMAGCLTAVRPGEGQAAVIWIDGRAAHLVRPGQAAHVWTVLNEVRVEPSDVGAQPRLERRELVAFEKADVSGVGPVIATVAVDAAHAGLVFFDGELVETLGPGRYGYWQIGRKVTA